MLCRDLHGIYLFVYCIVLTGFEYAGSTIRYYGNGSRSTTVLSLSQVS